MAEYLYSKDHEWALPDGNRVKVGISNFAQQELGDIAYVELPEVGLVVEQGEATCSIDSLKASSEIFAPVSGTVIEVNETLRQEENCGIVNEDPFGDGWIFALEMRDSSQLAELMSEEDYSRYTEQL